MLKEGSPSAPSAPVYDLQPRGDFAEWPNVKHENEASVLGSTGGNLSTPKRKIEWIKPKPRKLTPVELAWGAARGYKSAQHTDQVETKAEDLDKQEPREDGVKAQHEEEHGEEARHGEGHGGEEHGEGREEEARDGEGREEEAWDGEAHGEEAQHGEGHGEEHREETQHGEGHGEEHREETQHGEGHGEGHGEEHREESQREEHGEEARHGEGHGGEAWGGEEWHGEGGEEEAWDGEEHGEEAWDGEEHGEEAWDGEEHREETQHGEGHGEEHREETQHGEGHGEGHGEEHREESQREEHGEEARHGEGHGGEAWGGEEWHGEGGEEEAWDGEEHGEEAWDGEEHGEEARHGEGHGGEAWGGEALDGEGREEEAWDGEEHGEEAWDGEEHGEEARHGEGHGGEAWGGEALDGEGREEETWHGEEANESGESDDSTFTWTTRSDLTSEDLGTTESSETQGDGVVAVGPLKGCHIPRDFDGLMSVLYQHGYKTRSSIWQFFMDCIEEEPYITDMFTRALGHQLVDDFTAYIKDLHEGGVNDWWFGDINGDLIQELGDFVHFLMINPTTSPMTAEEIEMAKEDARKEVRDYEAAKKAENNESKEWITVKEVEKEGETLEQDDDDLPLVPPAVPETRVRKKGPAKRKAEVENPEEAWAVKWAPLTKKGVLDFVSNCSGQFWKPKTIDKSLSTQPHTVSLAKTIHNLKDSIKWKPIKPGQTLYVLDRIFCQVEPKNMTLQQLIRYCKGIDWNCANPVPENTPRCVIDTMGAIWNMWEDYRTDRPDEVQWWLAHEQGSQITSQIFFSIKKILDR